MDKFGKHIVALTGLVLATALTGCSTSQQAHRPSPSPSPTATVTLAAFAGTWTGHTRSLVIDRQGRVKESVGDGCCHPVIDLAYQLDQPSGTAKHATFKGKITSVQVHDPTGLPKPLPTPGQSIRVDFKNGLLTESVTEVPYCSPRLTSQRQGINCGA